MDQDNHSIEVNGEVNCQQQQILFQEEEQKEEESIDDQQIDLVKTDLQQHVTVDMFPSICRVCFSNENLRNIHEKFEEETLSPAEILASFGFSDLEVGNQLPQNVCENCTEKLLEMYLILDICKQSQSTLKDILEKANLNYTEHDYCETIRAVDKEQQEIIEEIIEQEDVENEIAQIEIPNKDKDKLNEENELITVFEINYEHGNDYGEVLQRFEMNANDPIFEDNDYETIKIEYAPEPEEEEEEEHEKIAIADKTAAAYSCEYCGATFTNASNFSRHKYVHLGDKPHKCEVCDKSFTRFVSLKIHMKYHTGENHHVCTYCGKQFTTISNYNRHILQHRLENGELTNDVAKAVLETITCQHCKKTFSSKHTLRTHMLVHQPKLFTCDICGKKFTFKGNLRSHYRSHTGEKPFQCEYCEKSFSFKSSLKEHIYTHTGERPHICQFCKRGFAQHQQLKTHLRTHTGERPFTCNYCGKTFATKVNMTVHERIHTGDTPFICSVCNKGFYDSSSLKKHKRRHEDNSSRGET